MHTLFVHAATISHFDFGTPMGTSTGIMWSTDGTASTAHAFEHGKTTAAVQAVFAGSEVHGVKLIVGTPVARNNEMNPRGDI